MWCLQFNNYFFQLLSSMDCWGSVCTITMATTSMRATTFTTVRRHYKHVVLCRVVDTDTRWVIILRNSVEHQYNILLYHMYGFSTLTTTLHILTINDAYHHFRCVDGKTCLRNHSNEGLYHVTHVIWVQANLCLVLLFICHDSINKEWTDSDSLCISMFCAPRCPMQVKLAEKG